MTTIVLVLGVLEIGGTEIRTLQLISAVLRTRPDLKILVYVSGGQEGRLDSRFRDAGAVLIHGARGWRNLAQFWNVCRRYRPDVVHTSVGIYGGHFAFAAFVARVGKRICHFNSTSEDWYENAPFKALIDKLLLRLFGTRFVGVCAAARGYARVPERKWVTIYNGIECEDADAAIRARASRTANGARHLIVLGRISPEKNYHRPLTIFGELIERPFVARMQLHFVGWGLPEHVRRLQDQIAASAIADSVLFDGPTDTPLHRLRNADALLLPSRREGLPGCVLEALSVGTPVISADLPGVREIAARADGVTLVPSDASDAVWVDAILGVISCDRSEAIIRSFRQSVFQFAPYVDQILSLWGVGPSQSGQLLGSSEIGGLAGESDERAESLRLNPTTR